MTFLYRYQHPEKGVVEGELTAASTADAYSALRKSGIRPMKVWPKPGLVNRVSALGKRGLAIIVLSLIALFALLSAVRTREAVGEGTVARRTPLIEPLPRQQLPDVPVDFAFRAERTLARFARPGDVSRLPREEGAALDLSDLSEALKRPLAISERDSASVRVMKRVVQGLKDEAAMLSRSGKDARQLAEYLVSRQRMEEEYRRAQLAKAKRDPTLLPKVNGLLERMGLEKIAENEL